MKYSTIEEFKKIVDRRIKMIVLLSEVFKGNEKIITDKKGL